MLKQLILKECGINISRYKPVFGGDINRAYCLYTKDSKYFLKLNSSNMFPGMFEKEAGGLLALQKNSDLRIPKVIKHGTTEKEQYLLLEWIEKETPVIDSWKNFGAALASMHQAIQPFFGWATDNYIGSLAQLNNQYPAWHSFYTDCRIIPLTKKLFETGAFTKSDIRLSEALCKKLIELFPPEPPALLHGDLWNGNFLFTSKGKSAVFDPAVYYGHREMDIGMTKLFGGFDDQFYNSYNEIYPLEKGWEQRLSLTQLYPLLVHAVIFKGHYVEEAKSILKSFA